jgi:hypothetical protein
MLTNYARTNLVNTKLNISDTSTMLSSYSTRINGKLNISDTSAMLSKYLRKIDTATLSSRIDLRVKYTDTTSMLSNYSTRINGKLNITDTSTLQPKSIPSYSFLANNTASTANAQALYFKDTSGTYTGTITWSTGAPTGSTSHTYRWTRIGNIVTLTVSLVYGVISTNNTTVTITLPADAPTPTKPSGLNSASAFLYPGIVTAGGTLTTAANLTYRGGIRNNSSNNGFEFNYTFAGVGLIYFQTTVTYYTN